MQDSRTTISFSAAEKFTSAPLAFNLMIKPAGSLCNLDCSYCYYLDKADIYGGVEPRMSIEMLEAVTRNYIEANDVSEVQFNWHGGEPLVMGLDFFRKAVEFQKKYAGGKTVFNTIQTNGTLVDSEWAAFFKDNNFLLGVSLDGPEDIHDKYRKDKGRKPTFARVMHGLEILYHSGCQYNILSTVNKECEGRGLEVYRFLKTLGTRYFQFNPVVEHVIGKGSRPHIVPPSFDGAKLAPWSVSALGFGKFLCDIFDEWVRQDVGRFYVNHFDATLARWCGVSPGICTYGQTCGDNFVVEHNGDVYPCDHFVYPEYRLGNMAVEPIRDLVASDARMQFGLAKQTGVPSKCGRCKWNPVCGGECPKHRFGKTENGETGLNALCEGLQKYFSHVAPAMDRMKALLQEEKAPALIMNEILPYK